MCPSFLLSPFLSDFESFNLLALCNLLKNGIRCCDLPQDPFSYGCSDFYSMGGAVAWGYDIALNEQDKALLGILDQQGLHAKWEYSSSPSVMQEF
jgi:hypothetical protein